MEVPELGFEEPEIRVTKDDEYAELVITKSGQSRGHVSCFVVTEQIDAQEYDNYLPIYEKVVLQKDQQEKIIKIELVNQ